MRSWGFNISFILVAGLWSAPAAAQEIIINPENQKANGIDVRFLDRSGDKAWDYPEAGVRVRFFKRGSKGNISYKWRLNYYQHDYEVLSIPLPSQRSGRLTGEFTVDKNELAYCEIVISGKRPGKPGQRLIIDFRHYTDLLEAWEKKLRRQSQTGESYARNDSLAVRAILDANGLEKVRVEKVSDWRPGRSMEQGKRITRLRLEKRKLHKLPSDIGTLTALIELDLSRNKLQELPYEITRLVYLKRLRLSLNRFAIFPDHIEALTELTQLKIDRNQISDVPPGIGNLKELEELNLAHNKIRMLPLEFCSLKKLRVFAADNNEIISLPGDMEELSRLGHIYIAENDIVALPSSIGELPRLHTLHMSGNEISYIPESILDSKTLKLLEIRHNPVSLSVDDLKNLKGRGCRIYYNNPY